MEISCAACKIMSCRQDEKTRRWSWKSLNGILFERASSCESRHCVGDRSLQKLRSWGVMEEDQLLNGGHQFYVSLHTHSAGARFRRVLIWSDEPGKICPKILKSCWKLNRVAYSVVELNITPVVLVSPIRNLFLISFSSVRWSKAQGCLFIGVEKVANYLWV